MVYSGKVCGREKDHVINHFLFVVDGHGSVSTLPHGSELLCPLPSSIESLNWHRIEAHVLKSHLEARIRGCECIAVEIEV